MSALLVKAEVDRQQITLLTAEEQAFGEAQETGMGGRGMASAAPSINLSRSLFLA